ncbi:hypothetical protein GLYMA_07G062450v4 [Glycine max]|nr:hypothetical protein GLYMA_07G062450v4 [Glycine max]KAH1085671.1 hypothetical protein GYH30_017578 [Glycine max]
MTYQSHLMRKCFFLLLLIMEKITTNYMIKKLWVGGTCGWAGVEPHLY